MIQLRRPVDWGLLWVLEPGKGEVYSGIEATPGNYLNADVIASSTDRWHGQMCECIAGCLLAGGDVPQNLSLKQIETIQ